MSFKSNRRDWLKLSALSATALAFSSVDLTHGAQAKNVSGTFIKLSNNENPYGPSPKVKQAIIDSLAEGNRYSSGSIITKLKQLIAAREGVKPENIVLGTGSGEILCSAAIAFGRKEIVAPNPTFPALMRYAEKMGATVKAVGLNEKFEHDFPAMAKSVSPDTSLIYVCNPNNPTASISPVGAVREFCRETSKKAPIFVDEAYLEYTDDFPRNSMIDLVRAGENVIVARTFSKVYGMAGLRVGYAMAKKELAEKLDRYRMTWYNPVSLSAAIAAYEDQEFVAQSIRKNAEVRRAFLAELDKIKLPYAPTVANFVWIKTGAKLRDLGDKMQSRNIIVGNAQEPFEDWSRVSIGTGEEMQSFMKAFKEVWS